MIQSVDGRTNIGPVNAALAKIGNAYTRSSGFHTSATEPPAQVSGVEPVGTFSALFMEIS